MEQTEQPPAKTFREQEAEIFLSIAYRLNPSLEKSDRARQAAECLKDDPTFMQLTSGAYDQYSVVDLWHAACLFTGINPQHECAKKVWLEENRQHVTGDAGIAVKKLFRLYKLAVHERIGSDGNARLGEFGQWARKEGLPPSAMFANALKTEDETDGNTSLAADDKVQTTTALPSEQEPQSMVMEVVGASGGVEPDAGQLAAPQPQATTPSPAPVEGGASNPPARARRGLLAPVIEAAQKECGDQFDAPAVWASLVRMAGAGKRPLLGVSDEGIKWQDSNDEPQFLNIKNLRDRLSRSKKKAR